MDFDAFSAAKNIQSLYLNPHGADIWFKIDDNRIPGHKLILSAMCPYYKTMFYGSLPETNEVNMSETVESVESFKEFLKFMYMLQPNLTMDNIEDVISLAKQSLSDECILVCEAFLKNSATTTVKPETIFSVYRLAILYDLDAVKQICEDNICVFADKVFKSKSLPEFPLEYLQMVLQRDALACYETDIFMACMTWAKAACNRNNLDPSNGKHLRDQLKDAVYQIRFTSMTKREVGRCIGSYPGLFTANELEEIICMEDPEDTFQPKQFNWTPRYFNLNRYNGRHISFSLVKRYDDSKPNASLKQNETTRFSCNRWVILKSFQCQTDQSYFGPIYISIRERTEKTACCTSVRFSKQLSHYFGEVVNGNTTMRQVEIVLDKPIIIRPNYYYDIDILFESNYILNNYGVHETTKRIDHDILFTFENHGIVSGLSIHRFDDRSYFQKVLHNPKTWMVLVGVGATVGAVCFMYFSNRNSRLPLN